MTHSNEIGDLFQFITFITLGDTIPHSKIGFHAGAPGGNMTGIGDHFQDLDSAGIPVFLKSVDNYGPIFELSQLARQSGINHHMIYRLSTVGQNDGYDYDVPDYNLPPQLAAELHWQETVDKLPPEFNKQLVWVEPINEVDKNRSEWLASFALSISLIANGQGYKVSLFGWSTGEPEPNHWSGDMMLDFLAYCGHNPNKAAVSLHEYSLSMTGLDYNYPSLVGRFKVLIDICNSNNIPPVTIHITEMGWTHDNVPVVASAMSDLEWVNEVYNVYQNVIGAAIWYLGPGFSNIANKTQPLIEPVTQFALQLGPPTDLPPIPPPGNAVWETVIDELFEGYNDPAGSDWYDQNGVQQVRNGWTLEYTSGTNLQVPPEQQAENEYGLMEAIFRWGAFVPPDEWDTLLNQKGHAYKMFARQQAWKSRTKTPVLPPGRYRVTLTYYDDCYVEYADGHKTPPPDPLSFEARIGIGDQSIPWQPSAFLADNTLQAEFVIDDDQNAWFRFRGRWAILNVSSWVKRFHVEKFVGTEPPVEPPVEPCYGLPRLQYRRVYRVLHPSLSDEQAIEAFRLGAERKETAGWSFDDAGLGALDDKTAVVIGNLSQIQQNELVDWYDVHYPGTKVEFEPAPGTPPPPPVGNFVTHWPTDHKTITQAFGANPSYYQQFGLPGHEGLDIVAPDASNIYAIATGIVYKVGDDIPPANQGGHNYGVRIYIDHQNGYRSVYAHLKERFVSVGDVVLGGVIIALANSTGNSTGSHLHLTMKKDGTTASGETNYPYDIIDPTLYLEHLLSPAPPPSTGNALLGLHSDADMRYNRDEIDLFVTARADMIKVLSGTNPQTVGELASARPGASWVVRAFLDFGGRNVSPQQFFDWTASDVSRTLLAIHGESDVVIELHNEPNLNIEGLESTWADGNQFNDWLLAVIDLYRNQFPGIKLIFPGLSPGNTVDGIRENHLTFWSQCQGAVSACDGVGMHIYWNSLSGQPEYYPIGQAITHMYHWIDNWFPGKAIWITESSNNKYDTDENKANQYIEFWQSLKQRLQIRGVTYFVSDATDPAFSDEIWIGRGIAGIVGNR